MTVKTPAEVLDRALAAGEKKVALTRSNFSKLIVLSILAGAYIALGGVLSLIAGYGFPEATAANPSLQRLLSGATFPIGLILVVVLGAELFTGNNAMLMPLYMKRGCTVGDIALNWTTVWCGNLVGALAVSYFLVFLPGLTAAEPYHSAIVRIAEAKVSMPQYVVFLKAIGANWCVCLAVWLAMSGNTLTEKMAGCWFPVFAFVALSYEHSIANMFFIPTGIFEGADVTIGSMVCDNLIAATLGNIVGGALFVGCIHAWLHLKRE